MNHRFLLAATAAVALSVANAGAGTGTNSSTTPSAPPSVEPGGAAKPAPNEKRVKSILEALHLEDLTKERQVRVILEDHFSALDAWRKTNETQIKDLWKQFDKARTPQVHDQAAADAALARIDGVYATFKPEHDALNARLSALLSPAQIETVQDVLTVNKVKVTYEAYGVIFHGLSEPQQAFILKNLKQAREEAIDAGSMAEKSAFFKKYKLKIQDYLTAQGFDVAKSYKEFGEKQKAEAASKKGAPNRRKSE